MFNIISAESRKHFDDARELFREYEAWLGMDLCFQGFEDEVRGLPGRYAPPDGRLLLAYRDDAAGGCIALRRLDDDTCEMKRLFVRDEFRGSGLGRAFVERLIEEARGIGYSRMRLDTYPPKMGKAVGLYGSYGFRPIPAYYPNPHEGILYMELPLR